MRITRDLLFRIAEDTVEKRVHKDSTIVGAYLHGTVLEGEDPVLGGAADIDLVFVHEEFDQAREIVRMTEDVHLDIEHHSKEMYQPPKELRQRPWTGYAMYGCKPLYDPQHFLDFTQAAVRGMFYHYENVQARAEELKNRSRATWLYFHNRGIQFSPDQVMEYFQAIEDAANAVASLFGPPLGGRRFLLGFLNLFEQIGEPDLYPDLIYLICGDAVAIGQQNVEEIKEWMFEWEDDLKRINQNYEVPATLSIHRHAYYVRAFEAMLGGDHPESALWPMLHTWTLMAQTMPSQSGSWQAVCERVGLTGDGFGKHLDGLDAFLDRVEVLIEEWEPEGGYQPGN